MKFILSLLLVLAAVTNSYAQGDAKMPHPITKSGSAAWMFTLSGLGPFGMDGFDIADIRPSMSTGSSTSQPTP